MAINKRLLVKPPSTGITPSEHFGVVLYEGDGSTSNSVNGGKFGAGAIFNGSSSQITTSNDIPLEGEFAISLWLRQNAADHSGNGTLFDFGYNSSPYMFAWIDNGTIRFDDNTAPTGRYSYSTATTSNAWNHIVITRNSSNTTSFYLNGSLDGTSSNFTQDVSHPFTIGYSPIRNGGAGDRLGGKVDQVRIFSKGLSSSEVSTLYAETLATSTSLDPLSEDTTDTLQVLGDSSCIATYRFENNEDDLSGNYNGTGTGIQYAAGRYGQGIYASGGTSGVQVTSPPSFFNSATSISVSVWIKPEYQNNNNYSWFSLTGENPSTATGGELLQIGRYNDGHSASVAGKITIYTGTNPSSDTSYVATAGKWHHIVATYSGTTLKVYANGTLNSTFSVTSMSFPASGNEFWIGRHPSGNTIYSYKGHLDQYRLFNKELSASEVSTLYQENSLVASYRFEGNANDDTRNYDGTASNVTYEYGLNFTPDFIWTKGRDYAADHNLTDSTRGVQKGLNPNTTAVEANQAPYGVTSFDTGGFTVSDNSGGGASVNGTGYDYVSWCLKAGGNANTFNIDGTGYSTASAAGLGGGNINPTGASINTAAGFGIYKASPTTATQSISHGLNSAPDMYMFKTTNVTRDWYVSFKDGATWRFGVLNSTAAFGTTTAYTANSSTMVIGGGSSVNEVVYAFHSVDGFSKFGTYVGNGSTDGPIVETGFEPAFVMSKNIDNAESWYIWDNKRDLTNPRHHLLLADASDAEYVNQTNYALDFLSNGFQLRNTVVSNASGKNYIYIAFAADPDTEQPPVAKSFSAITYTGNGTSLDLDTGFKPGLIWTKPRSYADNNQLWDIVRGAGWTVYSNSTNAENPTIRLDGVSSFNDDGFSIGNWNNINVNGSTYVAWAWKADDNEATIEEVIEDLDAVAVYKFEDNVNDVTSTYNGTATDITYNSSGKFNKSAIFNGSSSKVTVGNWGLTSNRDFSTSFWFKADSLSGDQWLYGQGANSGNFDAHSIYLRNNTTIFHDNRGNSDALSTSLSLSTGTWYHFAYTYNSSTGVHTGYINGASIGTATRTLDLQSNNSGGAIGTREIAGSYYFDGEIDQFRVYHATLTSSNVTTLYNETAADNNDLNLGMTYVDSIQSIVSANANAGFSIVKYEGNGVAGTKVPHGLSATPELIIIKNLDVVTNWRVYNSTVGETKYLRLNTTDAEATSSTMWNNTAPTSTVFTVGNDSAVNGSGNEIIAYCFHSVSGFSKIGSYTGTGTTNSITGLGFQPNWLMIKRATGGSSNGWVICDSVRGVGVNLRADTSGVEVDESAYTTSFDSDGFTLAQAGGNTNVSGSTYIYMAFKIN